MSRCVIDYLGLVLGKDVEHLAAVTHRTDKRYQIKLGVFFSQLQLYRIGVVLVDVKDYQPFRRVACDLSAELRAYRAASARDHYRLAGDKAEHLLHIGAYRVAPEQIFDRDASHLADCYLVVHKLIDARELPQLAVGLLADAEDIAPLLSGRAGNGKEYLAYLVLADGLHYRLPAAHNGNALDKAVPLVGVVVDYADHLVAQAGGVVGVAEYHLSRSACAYQHYSCARIGGIGRLYVLFHQQYEPVAEPRSADEDELEHHADNVIEHRHMPEEDLHTYYVQGARDYA